MRTPAIFHQNIFNVFEIRIVRRSIIDMKGKIGRIASIAWAKPNVITFYKTMRHKETEPLREPAMIAQWQEQIKNAVSAVTGRAINAMKSEGMRIEKTLIGDIKKRINGRKKRDCGAITENIDVLRTHYTWVKNLERAIISTGVPEWLL